MRRLYYGRPSSAGRSLLRRVALVFALFAAVILVFALDRDGLRDSLDGHVSFVDIIYFAFITITTVGYGDIVPVTTTARLIDALFVTPVRLFVWAIFLGTAYQFVAQRIIEDFRMRMRQSRLSGHIVICGYGLSGRSAAGELIRRGEDPARIVVIDNAETALLDAVEAGMVGLRGDATRESLLVDANIHAARTAIVCLGRDDTSVLCTLTMRSLAPELRIVAMVKEAENERLLQRGGASATICPSTVSGILMANSITSSLVASYVHDMLTIDGRVTLAERVALAADIGLRPTELRDGIALRIHRGDAVIGFWETEARVQEGDRLLIVAPRVNLGGASAAP
jgi:voltage-gated potassium channel